MVPTVDTPSMDADAISVVRPTENTSVSTNPLWQPNYIGWNTTKLPGEKRKIFAVNISPN